MKRKILILFLGLCFVLNFNACKKEEEAMNVEVGTDRPEYVEEGTGAEEEEKFVDADGDFDYETAAWEGPEGYVIVIPKDNPQAEKSAGALQQYYSKSQGIDLEIVADTTAETEKEILIGGTSRSQSSGQLAENALEVQIRDSKLVMNGGHDVMVDSAVQKFIRLAPEKNQAFTFQLDTDFVSTVLDGYEYVWGDEFEGAALDRSKWSFLPKMSGTPTQQIAYSEDVVTQADGRLQLRAVRCFDPTEEGVKVRVPYSVNTYYNMNFYYGYIEIRARVPYQDGAWPSFWMVNSEYLSEKAGEDLLIRRDYLVEVDVFENFGTTDRIEANIHKHEADGDFQWEEEKNPYIFKTSGAKLSQEYHTYGCEMTATEISMYVDGEKFQTFDITKSYGGNEDMSRFQNPVYVMFNNHVFTDDLEWFTTLVDMTQLPTEYFIDYVRLYQKPGEGRIWIDPTVKQEVEE